MEKKMVLVTWKLEPWRSCHNGSVYVFAASMRDAIECAIRRLRKKHGRTVAVNEISGMVIETPAVIA